MFSIALSVHFTVLAVTSHPYTIGKIYRPLQFVSFRFFILSTPAEEWSYYAMSDIEKIGIYSASTTTNTIIPIVTIIIGSSIAVIVSIVDSTLRW